MKENIKEFYIFQKRDKNSKTGKWTDDKWCKTIDDVNAYKDWWNSFYKSYKTEDELPETRIIHRVIYDEEISS